MCLHWLRCPNSSSRSGDVYALVHIKWNVYFCFPSSSRARFAVCVGVATFYRRPSPAMQYEAYDTHTRECIRINYPKDVVYTAKGRRFVFRRLWFHPVVDKRFNGKLKTRLGHYIIIVNIEIAKTSVTGKIQWITVININSSIN